MSLAAQHRFASARAKAEPVNAVPAPKSVVGFTPGEDRKLAAWSQIVAYFKALDRASDRVLVEELGQTTLGRPFVAATISSPANLRDLARYREIQRKLADPRLIKDEAEAEGLIRDGKTVVLVTFGVHSTEVGSSLTSMNVAYRLAADDSPRVQEVLDNCIVILVPSLNPDGVDIVKEWYDKTLGSTYEGIAPPELYHHYVGHDNNRDWYAFTQVETQLTVDRLHNVWHPQIVHDVHQQGATASRMFLPPYIDPIEPNVPPLLVAGVNFMGSAMAWELGQQGKQGITINSTYDAWTPARAYQHYHGGIRILSETASARLASPITIKPEQLAPGRGYDPRTASWNFPDPWPGGQWRLANIVDYMESGVMALLTNSARYRDRWLRGFYRIGRDAIRPRQTGEPFAFIISPDPRDPSDGRRTQLINILLRGGVEVYFQERPLRAAGVSYPEGTVVVPLAQPYGAFAKALLEKGRYPDLRDAAGQPKQPYDVTAHSLPLLMGVEAAQVNAPFNFERGRLIGGNGTQQLGTLPGRGTTLLGLRLVGPQDYRALTEALKAGRPAWRLNRAVALTTRHWLRKRSDIDPEVPKQLPHGAFLIADKNIAASLESELVFLTAGWSGVGAATLITFPAALRQGLLQPVRAPRVGLYKSSVPSMDEGWTRFILDRYQLPYTSVRDAEVRAGGLKARYDCLILPDQSARAILEGHRPGTYPDEYTGGLGEAGVRALKAFVEAGGTLVAFNNASLFAVEQFQLPVRNVLAGLPSKEFYGPGSILKINVGEGDPLAAGLGAESIAWFEGGPAFELTAGAGAKVIARFAPAGELLLSGWILGAERIANKAALVEVKQGRGRFVLTAFRPQYRAQSLATYPLVFNAILTSGVAKE